jgi:hypothetical protein
VEIRDWQQVGLPIGKPLGACQTLALGAVPVTTAVVGDANQAAVIALLDMAAERRGAASRDGGHDTALVGQEPTVLRGTERIAMAAEDVSHLQREAHCARYAGGITSSASRSNGLGVPAISPVATWA